MPRKTITAGGWSIDVDNIEIDLQDGTAKFEITMPKGINAAQRTKACTVLTSFRKCAQPAVIRRNLLVAKVLIDTRNAKGDAISIAGIILRQLNEAVTPRTRKQAPARQKELAHMRDPRRR